MQVEGEESPLGYLARAVVGGTVVPPHQLVEPCGVNVFARFQRSDYFQKRFFHGSSIHVLAFKARDSLFCTRNLPDLGSNYSASLMAASSSS